MAENIRDEISGATSAVNPQTKRARNSGERTNLTHNRYFYEDLVFRFTKRNKLRLGLVVETNDDYDEANEDDFEDIPKKGQVRVAWYPDGDERIINESWLGLADRTVMPGDILRRLEAEKDAQFGYCREVKLKVDLSVIGSKHVIKNVPTEKLIPLIPWHIDNTVVLGPFVGSITDVLEKAVLKAQNGAIFELDSDNFYLFTNSKNESTSEDSFRMSPIFRGNKVYGRLPSLDCIEMITPEISLPLNHKGKPKPGTYTVEAHYVDAVIVQWQCKGLSSSELKKSKVFPNERVSGKNLDILKSINTYESCMTQIFDRAFLVYDEDYESVSNTVWESEQSEKFKKVQSQQKAIWKKINKSNNLTAQMPVKSSKRFDSNCTKKKKSNTKNLDDSDPEWMSGTESCASVSENVASEVKIEVLAPKPVSSGLVKSTRASRTIIPKGLGKKDYKPQRSKILSKQKKKPETFDLLPGKEYPVDVILVQSTVTVVWQDGTVEENIPSTELYPIHYVDEHEYFPGDFVTKVECDLDNYLDYGIVQTADHKGRTAHVKWFQTYTSSKDNCNPIFKEENEMSVYDLKDHVDFTYGPGTMVIRVANFDGKFCEQTAGQVLETYPNGHVKVHWLNEHTSLCWPQDLYVVKQLQEDDIDVDNNDEVIDSDDSDEIELANADLYAKEHDIMSDTSWETQSENSELGNFENKEPSESNILLNVLRARNAILLLRNVLNKHPNLQSSAVRDKILTLFKECRSMDNYLKTDFFNGHHLTALLARTLMNGNASANNLCTVEPKHKTKDMCNDKSPDNTEESQPQTVIQSPEKQLNCNSLSVDANMSSTPVKVNMQRNYEDCVDFLNAARALFNSAILNDGTPKDNSYLMNAVMENIEQMIKTLQHEVKDDSGNCSRIEGSSNSESSLMDASGASPIKTNVPGTCKSCLLCGAEALTIDLYSEIKTMDLCNLLKEQMCKFSDFVNEKFLLEQNVALLECCNGIRTDFVEIKVELTEDEVKKQKEKMKEKEKEEEKKENEVNANVENEAAHPLETLIEHAEDNEHVDVDHVDQENVDEKNVEEQHFFKTLVDNFSQNDLATETESFGEHFKVLSTAPQQHKYYQSKFQPYTPKVYFKAIENEYRLLRSSLPPGVHVRGFEDRIDLLSVVIVGPKDTPYEDGLFFFDVQLGASFPKNPPSFSYLSFCPDRLNPNLYEDGKVCVSLLGTWSGRGTEIWGKDSTLLQVIVSIQGLILVAEPYYNEAGYEKQKGSAQALENSRMYNEMAIIKLVQTTIKIITKPPIVFRDEVFEHFKRHGLRFYERILGWVELSKQAADDASVADARYPDFPLIPASRGFCLALGGLLETLKSKILELTPNNDQSSSSSVL